MTKTNKSSHEHATNEKFLFLFLFYVHPTLNCEVEKTKLFRKLFYVQRTRCPCELRVSALVIDGVRSGKPAGGGGEAVGFFVGVVVFVYALFTVVLHVGESWPMKVVTF